jgi:glucosamine--fructose-6-phosphate aminotransferase (isomerizing)
LLATVNDPESPLARAAQVQVPIHAEVEKTVSTRTYVNSLAVGQLAALALLGGDVEAARTGLMQTAAAMELICDWVSGKSTAGMIGFPKRLAIGRGHPCFSLPVADPWRSFQIIAAPFQAGEFRHGPLELATPELTVLLFAGPDETRGLNLRLLNDLRSFGVNAFWVGPGTNEWQIEIPPVPSVGLPLMEILPAQLLSIHLARQIGVEPGHFFRSGKVTLSE